jgi:hypothetical protein
MVWRQQFGLRNGVYGGWISKPGYDVTTCSPGDFLLDTNAQVFQCVLSGNTNLGNAGAAGVYNTAVGLGGAFAPFSNFFVDVILYAIDTVGNTVIGQGLDNYITEFKYNTVSGVLTFSLNMAIASSYVFYARWSVFRAQF